MQSRKENKLFDKLVKKNYKNELEVVLENKFFGENAKSILLEILYKIETAYKDYEIVKKDEKTREEYVEEFINIIKEKCKTIKIIPPNSEQSKLLNNKTDKEIAETAENDDDTDPLLMEAIDLVVETGTASTSFIQRKLKVGYARAGRIIDQMEERGIISGYQGSKPRQVIMPKERWEELKMAKPIDSENVEE